MIKKLDSVLFVIFVVSILWLTWIPMDIFIKDIKEGAFDFWRDLTLIVDSLKEKLGTVPGKIVASYISLYLIFLIVSFVMKKVKP